MRELIEKGFKVTKEYPIGNGKTVDVIAEKNGKKIAIEIETTLRNKEKNIEKCKGLFDEIRSVNV